MSPYLAVGLRAFQRFATYRGATLAGVVTNTVFAFVYAGVFDAVHDRTGTVATFDATDTALYVFIAQGFLLMTGAFGDREISERITTGDIGADLYRPVDFQGWWLAHDIGKSVYYALARGLPPLIVGMAVLGLPLPGTAGSRVTFAVAIVGSVVLAFTVRFLANLTGFWLLDARGVVALVSIVQLFLAGHIVPLYFMPDRLQSIARLSPFAGITAHPVELLVGSVPGWSTAAVLAHQVLWIVILIGAGRFMLDRARRKLVVQGG